MKIHKQEITTISYNSNDIKELIKNHLISKNFVTAGVNKKSLHFAEYYDQKGDEDVIQVTISVEK